jgi:hypothetical protein
MGVIPGMGDQLGEPPTPQEVDAFLKRYAAGDPVAEIAADFDVSIGAIVRYPTSGRCRGRAARRAGPATS